ncbi:DUF4176 domain-containing protein [uncultured Lactococcus sp.]|uniref:DUF4176 domain-containing protein n=1 Tax=uncultured Lactococcus sp. TaxID=167973 RepID=UPI0027DDCE69|nr:DUF4176 domain-containing protein [uncultured Lactococcus sp.]
MVLNLIGNLLGLGSIVKVENENNTGLYVVLARGAMKEGEDGAVPRYLVGPHPYGEAPDQETFPLIDSEIKEVIFEGYTDEADETFLKDLLYQMENGRRPSQAAHQFKEALTEIPEVEESEDEVLQEMTKGKIDPFYKLRSLTQ